MKQHTYQTALIDISRFYYYFSNLLNVVFSNVFSHVLVTKFSCVACSNLVSVAVLVLAGAILFTVAKYGVIFWF